MPSHGLHARSVLVSSTELVIRSIVRRVNERAVNCDACRSVWNGANRGAHAGLRVVLRGSGGDILDMDSGGEVTVNLVPLLDLLGAELESRGLPALDVRTLDEVRVTQNDDMGATGQVLAGAADTLTSQLSEALVPALVVAVASLVVAGLAAVFRVRYPERSGGSGY